ncbi:MAG: ATP phosphoribosyltransferase [Clostridia bacterium]|nr:ATP phosphoribosyltransferase [Clostridia bacterium]
MINIALPKGRLGNKVYRMLAAAGYDCPAMLEDNRKLVFENEVSGLRYFLVKPSDVATYVARGAADVGVAGKDTLMEDGADVYELLDLGIGKCRMVVAAPTGFEDDRSTVLRVATKYPNTTRAYYKRLGRDIEIIKLHGSIELAPILGLSDVIVDIVETGKTLRENNLAVTGEIMEISARFVANRASYRFKQAEIARMTESLMEVVK